MLLTREQQREVDQALRKIGGKDRYQIENGFAELRTIGEDVKPYLSYRLLLGGFPGIFILLDTYRDDWAARLLLEKMETANTEGTARLAWNSLKSMGKLPKKWREPKFTTALWESCRTNPPIPTPQSDEGWIPIIKWNLLFKMMENDQTLQDETMDVFGYIGTKATLGLLSALEENDPDLTKTALLMLKRFGDSRAVEPLQALATHENSVVRMLSASAMKEVSKRVYRPPVQPQPPSQETIKQREEWSQQMTSPPISGQFDTQLEQRVVRALLRISAPDPDEKKAGWKEFENMGNDALPILRHLAQSGTESQKRQANSVINVKFS